MSKQFEKRKAKELFEQQWGDANFNSEAYDVFFDESTGQYMKVTIEYDTKAGVGRVKESVVLAESQPVAAYKMQEVIVKKIFNIKR